MNVAETQGSDGSYEQRYSVRMGSVEMKMVRRPVSVAPPEGTIAFVDDGPRFGTIDRQTGAHFKDGKWRRVRFEPTHWTHWEDDPLEGAA